METKVRINPRYSQFADYISRLPQIFTTEGDTVHEGRNMIKLFSPDGGTTLFNVKRYHIPALPNRLIYSLALRKPKGVRAFTYPQMLIDRGFETPEAVAYIEERTCGLLGYSYFVSIQCPYERRFYEIGNAPDGTYERLAEQFASFTAALHDSGVLHLDYSPGNILFTELPDGTYRFSLVDINRMRFGKVTMKQGLDNLKRLWGPKRFFTMLVERYAECRGFAMDEALDYALKRRAAFWNRYMRKHEIEFRMEL